MPSSYLWDDKYHNNGPTHNIVPYLRRRPRTKWFVGMQRRQVMSNRLKGKVALVTGGTSGIGLATAKRFAQEGATVYVTGRRQTELDKAVREIGAGTIGVQGDISKAGDLDRLYAQIKSEKGRLDILFANAGGGGFARLGEITEEQVDNEFGTNVKGTLFTVQKALPLMKEGGSVILTASTTSIKGMENFSVYSATKAAVRSFARTWTSDLRTAATITATILVCAG